MTNPNQPTPEQLAGRYATCGSANTNTEHNAKPSNTPDLAFFRYQPDEPTDDYYCGCMGWD
jgi:hypothetical protein